MFQSLPESLSSLKSLAQQALGQNNPPPGKNPSIIDGLYSIDDIPAGFLDLGLVQERHKSGGQPMTSLKNEAHIPPLLGVAPLGIVPLNKEHQFQYRLVFRSALQGSPVIIIIYSACWRLLLTICPIHRTLRDCDPTCPGTRVTLHLTIPRYTQTRYVLSQS